MNRRPIKLDFNQGDIRNNKKIKIGDKEICWKNQLEDGNCLFRALSNCLFDDSKYHWNLRLLIISYLKLNKEKYFHIFENGYFELDDEYFGGETFIDIFNNYVNYMSASNMEGGEIELIILNDIITNTWNYNYCQPILVYSIYNHKLTSRNIGGDTFNNKIIEPDNPLILFHKAHNHYWGGVIESEKSPEIMKSNIKNLSNMYNNIKSCVPEFKELFGVLGEEYDYIEDFDLLKDMF